MGGVKNATLAALSLIALLGPSFVCAEVTGVDIQERVAFAGGAAFGDVGAYEKIRGVAHVALDPKAAANRRIVDLSLAPRDGSGRVRFDVPFILLRPVHAAQSTLIYDVNNRGGIAILGQIDGRSPANNDPTTFADAGDGFLFRHGYSLLFSAWTWDVAPSTPLYRPLVLKPPVAKAPDGGEIFGMVENEFTVTAPTPEAVYAGQRGLTYEPATRDDPAAVLTRRARPDDPRTPAPRSAWRFLEPAAPGGPGRVALDGGFQPGVIYELTYRAKNPFVEGAGLAGIRDLLAYTRRAPIDGGPPPRSVLIFGISQSGRVIGRMLQDGLDVGEDGKLVFDGAFMDVPGAGGGQGFNSRFVQPTRHPSMLEEHDYPADAFPFTPAPSRDAISGRVASRLDNARDAHGRAPKLMIVNTSTEFWNRGASLIATSDDGAVDVKPPASVRLYGLMGAQHYVGRSPERAPFVNCVSTTDHYLALRALILDLDAWTHAGAPPPASAYPSIGEGTLVAATAYQAAFPKGLPIVPPAAPLAEPRLDFGPRFASAGVADRVPPDHGPAYGTLVPAPDSDGNDRGGVRLVELQAPLGTHTGWNERAPETGFAWADARFDGSFLPFARTREERLAAGDPRPSLQERYPSRAAFEVNVKDAAARQVAAGFLAPEDVERAVRENLGLYDRILAHDPADKSCRYLFP